MPRSHIRLRRPAHERRSRSERRTAPTELVLALDGDALPRIAYWGQDLGDAPETGAEGVDPGRGILAAISAQIMSAGVDASESPSILPTQSEGWTGTPMLSLRRRGIEVFPKFLLRATRAEGSSCLIEAEDPEAGLSLAFRIGVEASGLVRLRATLTNRSDTELEVERLWLGVPVPADHDEILSQTGHHLRERSMQTHAFVDGLFAKETWVGRPDFDSTSALIAARSGAGWETGAQRAVHLAWSGNGVHFAVRTPATRGFIGAGELLLGGEVHLGAEQSYETPELFASWGEGTNELASRFHAHLRELHPGFSQRPRPVTLNTWEALYYDHDIDKMMRLARLGAQIGVERFVVDDGWFTGRRDDTSALGDWSVDTGVWPDGLRPLSDLVHALGMEFGLWVEPEMISPRSLLAEAHPDWILRPNTARLPLEGRHQQVLDLTNPEAFDHLVETLSALVADEGIDYLKWDHNRFVLEAISPASGRPAVHAQTAALYRLLDELKERCPGLEIESCASGGGRIDLGILARTDRVWASDCTDPLERIDIQRGTSLLVPPEMIGAHIAQSPSHMTGRTTALATRAATALTGHLGVEWNLLDADPADLEQLRAWVSLYKGARPNGCELVHVDCADPAVRVTGLLLPGGRRSLWRFAALTTSQHYPYELIRLPGLDPRGLYRVRPHGRPEMYARLMNPSALGPLEWWDEEGVRLPGGVLAQWGIRPPHLLPGSAVLIEVEKLGDEQP